MKIFYLLFIIPFFLSAQKRITDPALLAQEKRMVYEKWGDFQPHPKYAKIFGTEIGPNISPHYSAVWGWLSFSSRKNKRYKDGKDIRPLKGDGLETKRLIQAKIMQNRAKEIKKSIDTIYKRSMSDMAHWTHLTAKADPLYLLYYKKMLRPLENFPEKPNSYYDWGFQNQKIFNNAKQTGQINILQRELDILKDTYKKTIKVSMPRGKRFLMYHKTLIGWRKFQSMIKTFDKKNELFFEYSKKLKNRYKGLKNINIQNDKEVIEEIMQKYNHKF